MQLKKLLLTLFWDLKKKKITNSFFGGFFWVSTIYILDYHADYSDNHKTVE